MGINGSNWQVSTGHVKAALDEFKVPAAEKTEVLAFVKRGIVD